MSRVTQENSKRSEALVATGSVDDDDMVSCFSDTDDFNSCADVDEEENVFVFAANAVDTAESGPLTFRAPGGVAPRYAPADSHERAPRAAGETGGGPLGVVSAIRERFGMSQAHAKLLTTAATGCPDPGASGPPDRVRGVFPLPYLVSERAAPRATLRAGARRRQVGRCRAVPKTNLVISLRNLLFGGADCMAAGISTRTGAAQLSALLAFAARLVAASRYLGYVGELCIKYLPSPWPKKQARSARSRGRVGRL